MPSTSNKRVEIPNIIHLDSKELPEIKNWKPGTRYRVTLEVEMNGMSFGGDTYGPPSDHDKDLVSGTFRVMSAKSSFGSGPVKQAGNGKPDKNATMSALQRKAAQ